MLRFAADREKLEVLFDIYARINSTYADLKALLTQIITSATELTEGEASSLMLVDPENNKLYFEIALGPKGPSVKQYSVNMGEGIAGWVAEKNTSLIVNDAQKDARFFPEIAEKIGFPTSSILAVPMRVKDKLVGVIEILNKRGGKKFTEEDLQWLEIFSTQAAIAVQNARSFQQVRNELSVLQDKVQVGEGYHTFVGQSRLIMEKLAIARKAAETDSSVLLLGESGVGKELFAEQIHLASPRARMPFIRVNCAAIPEALLESELFGHVKGAFTDAIADRRGRFELADGGTIFLDEIADMPLPLQAKLLRVIQSRTFERIGASEPMRVNVRIVAATNHQLEKDVADGRFRADLFYRLNVLPIQIPPLRERKEDIPRLAEFFLRKHSREAKKQLSGFSDEAMELLLSYAWPGNVRELSNAVERAVVFSRDDKIRAESLTLSSGGRAADEVYAERTLREALNIFKKHFITKALESNGWHQTRTAKALAIQRSYLSKLVKELSIMKERGV
jgi:transcriptional regulator with GAF, ATPase, and Fis domain